MKNRCIYLHFTLYNSERNCKGLFDLLWGKWQKEYDGKVFELQLLLIVENKKNKGYVRKLHRCVDFMQNTRNLHYCRTIFFVYYFADVCKFMITTN